MCVCYLCHSKIRRLQKGNLEDSGTVNLELTIPCSGVELFISAIDRFQFFIVLFFMAQKQNNLFQLILLRSSVSIVVYFHYRGKFKTNWIHGYLIFYVKYCTFNVVSRLHLAGVHIEYKAVSNSYTYCFKAVVVIILEKLFTCFLESSYSSIISAHLFRRQNFAILKYKREICLNQLFFNYFSKPVQPTKLHHPEVRVRDFCLNCQI